MGELRDIPFAEQPAGIKEKVQNYWTKRADGFLDLRRDEIHSGKAELWRQEILTKLPRGRWLKILDVGCGTGFFEVLLGREGHDVTGIDLTREMIVKAEELIRGCGLQPAAENEPGIRVMTGDAEKLDFADGTFDAVISRNLTWTLPHPITAYREWYRVLKKEGVLLNFDAEYARNAHNLNSKDNIAHKDVSSSLKEECHRIYHMLTISNLRRPAWDEKILRDEVGFARVEADEDFSRRIFTEEDEFYIPDRMFEIVAVK